MAAQPADTDVNTILNPLTGIAMAGIESQTDPDTNDPTICTICQEEIANDSPTLVHNGGCRSNFHADCLHESLVRDGRCPNCRIQVHKTLNLEEKWDIFEEYYQRRRAVAMEQFGSESDESEEFLAVPGFRAQASYYRRCCETRSERTEELQEAHLQWNRDEDRNQLMKEQTLLKSRYLEDISYQQIRHDARQQRVAGILTTVEKMEEKIATSCQSKREGFGIIRARIEERAILESRDTLNAFNMRKDAIERRYSDNIAYFVWEMKNRRAADPFGREWKDDPIVPA